VAWVAAPRRRAAPASTSDIAASIFGRAVRAAERNGVGPDRARARATAAASAAVKLTGGRVIALSMA
jgi:hypothetical protein